MKEMRAVQDKKKIGNGFGVVAAQKFAITKSLIINLCRDVVRFHKDGCRGAHLLRQVLTPTESLHRIFFHLTGVILTAEQNDIMQREAKELVKVALDADSDAR